MKHLMAGLAMTIGLALPAEAATVLNGSFEMGPTDNHLGLENNQAFGDLPGGGWDIYTGLANWAGGAPGVEVQTSGTVGINAQDGDYYLELDSTVNSSIEQSIAMATGNYTLNFWYQPRNSNPDTNGIGFSFGSLLDGNISGPSVRAGTQTGLWTKISTTFEVTTASTYLLKFFATGTSDGYGGFLDNVSVTYDAPLAAVPVPAAGGLLIAGLGGLAQLRRRKV